MLLAVNTQVCSTLVSRPTTTHHLRWAGVAARIGRGRGHGRGMGDSPPLRWTACGPVDPWLRTKTTAFAHARVRLDHCVSRGLPDSSLRARPSDPFRSYDHHPLALGFGGLYHALASVPVTAFLPTPPHYRMGVYYERSGEPCVTASRAHTTQVRAGGSQRRI